MITKGDLNFIDETIKVIWTTQIKKDYDKYMLLREDSLKCSFYYHLRRKFATLMKEKNLRIYPEYYFEALGYRADLVICQIDPNHIKPYLKDMVVQELAVIELKFANGESKQSQIWIESDVAKLQSYIQSDMSCQFYFGVIYEDEREDVFWIAKQHKHTWAKHRVTELGACYIDDTLTFDYQVY